MDQPHCNNSNNIHVAGAQLHEHPAQIPDKSRCNGVTENDCPSFDQGYSSIEPGNAEQHHSTCYPESEQHVGHFRMPGSVPNGPLLKTHYQNVNPMQSPQQNGHFSPQSLQRHSGQGGPLRFSYSGETVDEYQRSDTVPNVPSFRHDTQDVDAMQRSMQNGYINLPSPRRYSGQGGPMHLPHSGEHQSPGPIPNGPPLTPNSQNAYTMQNHTIQNGPTSPRPPPVVRKHSSFTRQNAIEEENDDDRDELNDSGFGSMCRTTSREQPRRSRSRDVSDAPADDVNNNLAPRKLQRAHSSQEKTDNELAQFHAEKRRCSSEQLQRSNGSSGYYSGNDVQGAAASHDDDDDDVDVKGMFQILGGLKDRLPSWKPDVWSVEQLHEVILSDPVIQPLLGNEVHCQLMRELSRETFMSRRLRDLEIYHSNTANHTTQGNGNIYVTTQEIDLPNNSSDLCISPDESPAPSDEAHDAQQGVQHTDNATRQVPDVVVWQVDHLHHGIDRLQTLLETRAYCEAMEVDTCCDPECLEARMYQAKLKKCCRTSTLGKCIDCKEIVKAYWNHSLGCGTDRCVLPFCAYFKDLRSETGVLHDPDVHCFEGAFGCLIRQKEIDVLEKLHELQQLQQPAADEEEVWSANASAESYLRKGQPNCHLTPEGRLCKFGRFTPIRCKAMKPKQAEISVVIKKLKNYEGLTTTLRMLHRDSDPLLKDLISTCLWYRQIQGGKLLVCSTYLSEKSLSSYMYLGFLTLEKYWMEACNAAIQLHEWGILYLNWKVDHVFVTQDDHVKLCNFGYAVDIRRSTRNLRGSCSDEWRGTDVPDYVKTGLDPRIAPPEVLDESIMDGRGLMPKSDSWGLGCLLYQLHEGCLPYPHLSHLGDHAIREKRLADVHSTHVSPKSKWCTEACFNQDQNKRLLPAELVECLNRYNSKMEETRYCDSATLWQEQ